jgi:hypothetical protein
MSARQRISEGTPTSIECRHHVKEEQNGDMDAKLDLWQDIVGK